MSLLTEEYRGVLHEVRRETVHDVKFYVQNHQFWFKNSTTAKNVPLPIALLESVLRAEPQSEARRLAMESLRLYIERE